MAILMHVNQKGCHVISTKMMSQLKLVHRKFTVFRLFLAPSRCDYHVALSPYRRRDDRKLVNELLTLTSHDHRNFFPF